MNKFRPSAVKLQETKLTKPGTIKLSGYQVFEQTRKNKRGGGLLTAVDEDTNPVLISTGKEDNEILTIQADLGREKLRIINAYGPQEDDGNQKILGFWQEKEAEIMNAENNDCLIIIELDANAKVGDNVIKGDPNPKSNNGQVILDIVLRHNLFIVNSSDLCTGLITRERILENKTEKSVIDYIIVCERMKRFLQMMTIDDQRIDVLRHFTKRKNRVITSDHNILYSKFSLTFDRKPRKIRQEFFQFKCEESKNNRANLRRLPRRCTLRGTGLRNLTWRSRTPEAPPSPPPRTTTPSLRTSP
jgi:hypothetical protein